MELEADHRSKNLPWWTWLLPILLFQAGTQVSLYFQYAQGVADLYFPTAISIILVNWWGFWRVVPAIYLNATLSTGLWGIENPMLWPLYAVPETILTILSWLLFSRLMKGKYWLPNVTSLIQFTFFGVLVPILVEIGLLEFLLIGFNEHRTDQALDFYIRNFLGEFTSCFGLVLPVLYFGSPALHQKSLLFRSSERVSLSPTEVKSRRDWIELALVYALLLVLNYFVPFLRFWFIYGFFSLYIAIRFGFGATTVTNYFIFCITYFIPELIQRAEHISRIQQQDVTNILLGTLLLYVFAAFTGRVISDLKITEATLQFKNKELQQTNRELDRFVYSASHDLSAPLKSVRGLINISRYDPNAVNLYLEKMEISITKLEEFINEILDYARNKRMDVDLEAVRLKDLCQEVINNLKFMEGYPLVTIRIQVDPEVRVISDRMRLKMVVSNIISNAVKFQRKQVAAEIEIRCRQEMSNTIIEIQDNGIGMKPETQAKIFDMFYRGTDAEKGSGLGLYIAREVVEKLRGSITVKSELGEGSQFTIRLPQ